MKLSRQRLQKIGAIMNDRLQIILPDSFYDLFKTPRATGAINGTPSEPGPGNRTVIDTQNKISISGRTLLCSGGKSTPAWSDPQVQFPAITRAKGILGCWLYKPTTYDKHSMLGYQFTTYPSSAFNLLPAYIYAASNASFGSFGVAIGEYAGASIYAFIIALRATGAFFLVRGGKYPSRLLYHSVSASGASLTPEIVDDDAAWESRYYGQANTLWLPVPLLSDGFSASISDGLGHAETTGLGSGGSGLSWTARLGTWGVSAGKMACSALDGGTSTGILTTVIASTPHVIFSVQLTRSGGSMGMIVRYADANNYIYTTFDGTNIALSKVVAGVDSVVLAATAVTYVAGTRLVIIADCQYIKVIYNEIPVGAAVINDNINTILDATLQTGTGVGLYTTNTGNTFDNALVYAIGIEGQYDSLFDTYFPSRRRINVYCVGDSKTSAADGYVERLSSYQSFYAEYPYRNATFGWTTNNVYTTIDARLAIAVGTPDYVFYNVGVNDTNGGDGINPTQADWQTQTGYILDAIHTKWPNAQIILNNQWCRLSPNACNTIATWRATVVTARSSFCRIGWSEWILENGDNGVTYTADGIHPNYAGYAIVAQQWRNCVGYN